MLFYISTSKYELHQKIVIQMEQTSFKTDIFVDHLAFIMNSSIKSSS